MQKTLLQLRGKGKAAIKWECADTEILCKKV